MSFLIGLIIGCLGGMALMSCLVMSKQAERGIMKLEFKRLIRRIRGVNRKAAKWLMKEAMTSKSINPHGQLPCVMYWRETPHGHDFWSGIHDEILRKYEGKYHE